ncbi:MAG: YkgJ family cysteine cluster protein [Panacagrimonas sp.]
MDDTEFQNLLIQRMCSQKCMGHAGNKGGCCTVDNRDWILGPVRDVEESLARLSRHFARPLSFDEIFINFEEGKALFPTRPTWQNPANYPALRVQTHGRHACRFYDQSTGGCSVYDARPGLCRGYQCGWLKETVGRVC